MPSHWSLRERNTGRVVVEELEFATTFWRRFVGLQFRKSLPKGHGLLIAPCNSIHTHWMRFPIDAVFLDETACVVSVRKDIQPWRFVAPVKGTVAVLEVPANTAGLVVGTRVELSHVERKPPTLPKALHKWNNRTRGCQSLNQ